MKIVCPACEATYEVPEVVVTSRRKMRCARCSKDWVPADVLGDAPAGQPAAPASVAAAPPAPAMRAAEPLVDMPAPDPFDAGTRAVPDDRPSLRTEAEAPARRDDEPYQLALRPETHVSVFNTPYSGPTFGSGTPRIIQAPRKGPPIVAWALSILVLVLAVVGALVFRAPVMKAWPPSARLYAALGLVQN
jgi:hypothetical protein